MDVYMKFNNIIWTHRDSIFTVNEYNYIIVHIIKLVLFSHTLKKLAFHFLSNSMEFDRGDSFPFDFEPNGIPFGSKSKGKLLPRTYPIQFEKKWNTIVISV